jgi:dephospho-CoA kinase
MRYIILLSGYSESGKDYFADFLVKNHKYIKLSFANELKKYTAKKYKFNYSLTQTQEGKKTLITVPQELKKQVTKSTEIVKKSVRDLLIEDAVYLRNKEGADVFAKYLSGDIVYNDLTSLNQNQQLKNIVISDFRFPIEMSYLKWKFHGGNFKQSEYSYSNFVIDRIKNIATSNNTKIISVRINRFDKSPVNSTSETQLDDYDFDYIIDNKSTIEDYEKKIKNFIDILGLN